MLEELRLAGGLLGAALERYANACSAVAKCKDSATALSGVSQTIADIIPGQIERIASFEAKLKEAKTSISQTRNTIPTIAPVNTLPVDTLSYIFELALCREPCYYENQDAHRNTPRMSPEIFTQICSYWRQVALHSRSLWSHIDLVLTKGYRYNQLILGRATTFTTLSDPLPLDIHIVGRLVRKTSTTHIEMDSNVFKFYSSVARRARSLKLPGHFPLMLFHISVFERWFATCTPEMLDQLVITGNNHGHGCASLGASGHPVDLSLGVSYDRLEECLLHLKRLRLVGVYFQWTSQAYRGLVELRLIPRWGSPGFPITTSQVREILANNPKLQAIELGLEIEDEHVGSALVSLMDLEVLDLRSTSSAQYGILLSLISPGPKPLQLSLKFPSSQFAKLFSDTVQRFLARSNVAELHVGSNSKQWLELLEMIGSLHVGKLHTLSLTGYSLDKRRSFNRFDYKPPSPQAINDNGLVSLPGCSRLYALHLANCTLDLDYLRELTQKLPIYKLKITECSAYSEVGGFADAEDCGDEISQSVSVVEFEYYLGTLEEWSPWD